MRALKRKTPAVTAIFDYQLSFRIFQKSTEWSNKTVNTLEIPVNHIGGIKSEYGRKAVKMQVLIALGIILLSLVGFGLNSVLGKVMLYVSAPVLLAGLLVLIFSRRRVFTIEIFTKSTMGSVVSLTNDFSNLKSDPDRRPFRNVQDDSRFRKTITEAQSYRPKPIPEKARAHCRRSRDNPVVKCGRKRTVFDLLSVYTCAGCEYRREDELIVIGRQVIAVYYLGDNCPHLPERDDYALSGSSKLRLLLKDAISHDNEIMLFLFEQFNLRDYYDLFEKIMD